MIVDRFVVEEKIGEGGMAAVYRIRHQTLGSRHALKVLTITNQDVRTRLLQEGQVQASLQHPNLIGVSDILDLQGAPGLVMEYVQGPPLDHWLHNYQPPLEEALILFRGIVAGVGSAHAKGVLHRDLKPANILLHVDDRGVHPKVTDFGLAKLTHTNDQRRTRTGTTMGTPQYMAPEQIRDASSVDRRADLYSLGVILYELVCHRPPFENTDVIELFTKVASGDYPAPRSIVPELPQAVVDCIDALMEVDRHGRLTDCASVLEMLDGTAREGLTTAFGFDADDDLPPPRGMPTDPGPTSLPADSAGARMASRWLKPLVSVAPETTETSDDLPEPGDSMLEVDLDTPVPVTQPSAAPPSRRGLAGGVLIGFLLLVIVFLLLSLLGVGLFVATQGPETTDNTPREVIAPVPAPKPEQPPRPDPVPSTPTPVAQPTPRPLPSPPQPAEPEPAEPEPQPVQPVVPPDPVAPRVRTGRVRVEKDADTANVVLVGPDGRRHSPNEDLPVGTYTIYARFTGYPEAKFGTVNIPEGGIATVRCASNITRCVAK